MMTNKPIKRNASLITLSRDHHEGLLFCWKIRQGVKKSVDLSRIRPYLSYFLDTHLSPHFRAEEDHLFNQVEDEGCTKAMAQHRDIRELVRHLVDRADASPEAYLKLADTVDAHIRFEERILFPHLESVLPPEKLQAIGSKLDSLHATHESDKYSDEFWVNA